MQQGHTCHCPAPARVLQRPSWGKTHPQPLLPDTALILPLPDTAQERRSRPGAKHGHASPNTGSEDGILS